MSAVYIGAGTDIRPIKVLKQIKIFNYFDGQPHSEFGILLSDITMPDGSDGYSRPNFTPMLDKNMDSIGMKLTSQDDNIRVYSNGDQTVYYHTNTAIPKHYEKIKNTIRNFDTLIVAGHDPNSIFLDATRKKIHFIGFEDTVYMNENDYQDKSLDPNSIIYRMHNDNIKTQFNSFSYVKNSGMIYNFNTWNKFFNFYLTNQ